MPVALVVLCPHPRWTLMTMKTFPLSSATPQKRTTNVTTQTLILNSLAHCTVASPMFILSSSLSCVGEVQAFHEDLNGRQPINEIYNFSVDKLYDILFTESQFMSDFMEQRRFSGLCL